MTRTLSAPFTNPIPTVTILIAIAMGLLLLLQPVTVGAMFIGMILLAVCIAITPMSGFIFMLVLAPARNLLITEAPGLFPIDIGLLTVALNVAVIAMYRIARGQRILNFQWSSLYLYVGIFAGVVSLTVFTALSPGAWLTEWLKWLVVLILITLCLETGKWEWLVFAVVLGGLAHAIIGLYTFLGGSGALHLLINDRFFRAFGTFGQPNPFGGFMGLIAPLAIGTTLGYALRIYRYWRFKSRLRSADLLPLGFYGIASAFISLGVIISWSRGAWLAFGVALVVVSIAIPRRLWQSLMLFIMIIILGAGIWFTGLLPASIEERISSATAEIFAFNDVRAVDITPENYAVVERLAHWQAALNMADANPWLGVGMGNYEVAYDDYRLLSWTEPLGHAHNYYLNVLAEAGMIGLLAYLTLWAGVFVLTLRTRAHPDSLARFVCIGLLGTWTYLSVHSLTDQLYVNNMFLHIGVMLGIVAILHNETWNVIRVKRKHSTK